MDKVLREALILKEGEELFASKEECEPFCLEEIAQKEESSESGVAAH
jgi:hypothetical protein